MYLSILYTFAKDLFTYYFVMDMGHSTTILMACGKDLGFSMKDGQLTLAVSNTDFLNMRSDLRKLGADMRKVMERKLQ